MMLKINLKMLIIYRKFLVISWILTIINCSYNNKKLIHNRKINMRILWKIKIKLDKN